MYVFSFRPYPAKLSLDLAKGGGREREGRDRQINLRIWESASLSSGPRGRRGLYAGGACVTKLLPKEGDGYGLASLPDYFSYKDQKSERANDIFSKNTAAVPVGGKKVLLRGKFVRVPKANPGPESPQQRRRQRGHLPLGGLRFSPAITGDILQSFALTEDTEKAKRT